MKTEYPFSFNHEEGWEVERETFIAQQDEATMLFGANCVYLPVSKDEIDPFFGEYLAKRIERGTPIKLVVDNIEEDFYPEDSGMFSKFGYSPQLDVATFWATKNYWDFHSIVPTEDNLILYKKIDKLFEIHKVTLIHGYQYRVDCRLFNYTHEDVADDVIEPAILDLETLADEEVEKITTPILEKVVADDIIDDSDFGDDLYD